MYGMTLEFIKDHGFKINYRVKENTIGQMENVISVIFLMI